ncbi:MAG: YabP/YqfC family sporulation protein [Clostridiales bacterium]|nr:YabP/YqfC family sporulation protein [Clostridiales bacterium]
MFHYTPKKLKAIADDIDFDELAVKGLAHIEIMGNRKAVIDGCKGVLDYNENLVRLNTGKNIIRFTGDNLTITSMNNEQAIVSGDIITMDFS